MPKSRVRQKKVYTPPADLGSRSTSTKVRPSASWVPVTAVAFALVGVAWLVTWYLSGNLYPVLAWGNWNLAIGFGALIASLAIFTNWR